MQRIAFILLLFVLLMNGRHIPGTPPARIDRLTIEARPITVDPARARADYGPLRLLGLWELSSPNERFGGISALAALPGGQLLALNDTGQTFGFASTGDRRRALFLPLPIRKKDQAMPPWSWDSESLTLDPATGKAWVGFELLQRICRYGPGLRTIERCRSGRALRHWPPTMSIESLVRLGDGRFLAISEGATIAGGAHDVLLWSGDPAEKSTPPPVHLGYFPPTGFRPTDAVWLGGDRLLVLNRRLTLADGFTARLALVRLPKLKAGAMLRGEVIARFRPSGVSDNMEALAVGHEPGGPVLWVASDDNHFFLQRSLLFRFALPPEWISDAPPP